MGKIKTQDLIGATLDWAVAKCEGDKRFISTRKEFGIIKPVKILPPYSTNWSQGGPIIERERITLNYDNLDGTGMCKAYYLKTLFDDQEVWQQYGPTPLIAAMRCYVASKLGDEIEVPDELL